MRKKKQKQKQKKKQKKKPTLLQPTQTRPPFFLLLLPSSLLQFPHDSEIGNQEIAYKLRTSKSDTSSIHAVNSACRFNYARSETPGSERFEGDNSSWLRVVNMKKKKRRKKKKKNQKR